MSYALVSHASARSSTGTGGGTTASIDTTGASLLVAAYAYDSGAAASVSMTDSKSNTWSALTDPSSVASHIRLYYAKNPTVGTGHTFTGNGPNFSTFGAIAVAAFSGADTTAPFDVQNGASGTSNPLSTGSITPGVSGELLIVGYAFDQLGTPITINSSFLDLETQEYVGGTSYGVSLKYLIQTSAASVNPAVTRGQGSGAACAAAIASFLAAGGGGGGPTVTYPQLERGTRGLERGLALS